MTKRMLIDDTQPEETRVVVINGNKLEDVEFESSSRKQIKGNVYLAKVMRIEPSLQAAFVDYGGNRHGFLAFGEIHPDYYNVDEKTMRELEKEIENTLENKKQNLKERELERARIREEKAAKRAQRMEQESAESGPADNSAEIEKIADRSDEKSQPNTENAENQSEPAINSAIDTETTKEEIPTEKSSRNRQGRGRRGRPAKGTHFTKETMAEAVADENQDNVLTSTENAPDNAVAVPHPAHKKTGRNTRRKVNIKEDTTVKTDINNQETVTVKSDTHTAEDVTTKKDDIKEEAKAKEEVKTLAESAGISKDKISEKDNGNHNEKDDDSDYRHNESDEAEEIIVGNSSEDEVAADDDDDSEYDFEVQKKLILMRKLFHQNKIQDVIKEGQILLVQVVKEERGNKGAALTTYLSLAGRYCVLMPNRIKSGGVSRKITNVSDRKRLKSIIKELPISSDMSLIVRTAGEEKTKSDIVRDYNYLIRTWEQIRLDSLKSAAPALIYEEGNLIKRALRDMFTKEISEIIVDGDNAYQAARDLMKILSPHNMKKLKSCKSNDIPLFQRFQLEGQLDKLHDTNVQLESGGYLVINPTEALVSIDVNSGRATKEKDLEETALKTNLEAADEIAKQLRMRNLAGLIVIDFIDMDEPKNNQAIEKRMKEAMKKDRARVQIGKMSCFGLLEISRQRMHSSFFESNYQICPHCHGRGIIRTIESGAVSILRTIEEEGNKNRSSKIIVSLPRDVAVYLLNQKRTDLVTIEQRYKMQIIICADESVKNIADFKIERTKLVKPIEENIKEPKRAEPAEAISQATESNNNSKPLENNQKTDGKTKEENVKNERNSDENDNSENGENGYRRRNGGRRDRRNRFDRRRNGGRRNHDAPAEENNEKPVREEAVILYNSHEMTTSSEDGDENSSDKRKVAWWKKLING